MEVKVIKDSFYGNHRKVTLQVEARESDLFEIETFMRGKLAYCTRMINGRDVTVITDSHWHLEVLADTLRSKVDVVNLFLDDVRRALAKSKPVKRSIHAPFVSDNRINEAFKSEDFEDELKKVVGLSVYQCLHGASYEPEDVVLERFKSTVTHTMITAFNHCGVVYNEVEGYVSPHVFMSQLTNYGV